MKLLQSKYERVHIMKLVFIPQPHKITMHKGFFRIPDKPVIGISDSSLYTVACRAETVFQNGTINIIIPRKKDALSVILRKGLKPGGYRLNITPAGVRLEADSVEAAFDGLQTLVQVAMQCSEKKLPCLLINDWPDFKNRGVYYDVCRGRVPKFESLMEQVELLAHYKINHYQLYFEHTFKFRGHPDIWRGASPLSAEDMMDLDAFCKGRHVDLVLSLASLGHMGTILKHPQYHYLAEDLGKGEYPHAGDKNHWGAQGKAHLISPANSRTYDFLDSLYSELLPSFSSKLFNVCCDEAFVLGWGQTHALCKKLGTGRAYLNHIIKLKELCAEHGKKIMFWGDIIRSHPKLIPHIPKDVIVLDWGYDANHPFARISDFRKAGLDFYACPGTSSWCSLFPRIHEAEANIHGFAAAACRNKAVGLLNTDWGDGGHYNFMELSWHGYLFGAEQAWNVNADRNTFTARFAKLFLGTDDPAVARAIIQLGDITHLNIASYYQSIWQHLLFAKADDKIFAPKIHESKSCKQGRIRQGKCRLNAELGRKTIKQLKDIRTVFESVLKERDGDPHSVMPYWLFAVDSISVAAKKLTVFGEDGRNTPATRIALKKEMRSLMKRFERLWMARNQRSEISVTLKRYRKAINSL